MRSPEAAGTVPDSSRPTSDQRVVELVHALSHDLRSPLTLVTGLLQTLARPELAPQDPELAQLLRSAVEGAARMRRMLDDFVAAAGAMAGDLDNHPRTVDPAAELRRFVAEDPRFAGVVQVRPTEPGPQALVDPQQLCRIVAGLALGAIGRGATRITADVAVGTGRLVIVVLGNDSGLPPDLARRLTGGEEASLRGLGVEEQLSVALTRSVGGSIAAVPIPGGSTSLRAVLPIAAAPE